MAWTFHYDENTAILVGENHGLFSPAEEEKLLTELTGLAGYDTYGRILIDHRESQMNFEYLDIISRPDVYNAMKLRKTDMAAFVFSEMREGSTFFETVCQNRGFYYRVFDDYVRAVDWLVGRK